MVMHGLLHAIATARTQWLDERLVLRKGASEKGKDSTGNFLAAIPVQDAAVGYGTSANVCRDDAPPDAPCLQVHVIVQHFEAHDTLRQRCIDEALRNNTANPYIHTVHVLSEAAVETPSDLSHFTRFSVRVRGRNKIIQKPIGHRLTFGDAFRYADEMLRVRCSCARFFLSFLSFFLFLSFYSGHKKLFKHSIFNIQYSRKNVQPFNIQYTRARNVQSHHTGPSGGCRQCRRLLRRNG
jgi:hypothetical protein